MLAHTCPLLPTHLSHILVSLLVPFHNLAALVFPFLIRRRAVPKKASYPLRLPLHPVAHTLIHGTSLPLTTLLPDNPFSLSPAHRLLESLPFSPLCCCSFAPRWVLLQLLLTTLPPKAIASADLIRLYTDSGCLVRPSITSADLRPTHSYPLAKLLELAQASRFVGPEFERASESASESRRRGSFEGKLGRKRKNNRKKKGIRVLVSNCDPEQIHHCRPNQIVAILSISTASRSPATSSLFKLGDSWQAGHRTLPKTRQTGCGAGI
ncbi:hypothetical protein QBC33DRAFT_529165 [Phialemonium atrogriseum]|uniref:Uncharacterized protein n=1 Tax=Phialemonium atrogriseum TaxID=1093897 RepID=A0AAJ0C6Y5_9PEZI|nr:uncharacterized protein QBC33DRAFT_529165 [Phialemonium atrogriseum]KAK1769804.1 hypothetical protein QBC33DRAFT_529165 [Phialemonium atrogriseum]